MSKPATAPSAPELVSRPKPKQPQETAAHLQRFYSGQPRRQKVRTRNGTEKTFSVRTVKYREQDD